MTAECGVRFKAREIVEAGLPAADEIIISSATREVLPVTQFDSQPGPVFVALYEAIRVKANEAQEAQQGIKSESPRERNTA